MNVRIEQRQELPLVVENIGLGKWHVRWNITKKTGEDGIDSYEYKEAALNHEPTTSEIKEITAL